MTILVMHSVSGQVRERDSLGFFLAICFLDVVYFTLAAKINILGN